MLAAGWCTARAETLPVTINGLVFAPVEIHAKVGDIINWINQDFVAHTATARGGEWDVMIAPHQSTSLKLNRAGRIDFYCRFHPNMRGTIVIAPE
jgi:plastocyanin